MMNTLKRYVLYGLLIFLLIKLPSMIFHANVCIDCIGEEPSFHLHWRQPGIDFMEARCYKDDFQYLQYLNQCRKASQDTVFNLAGIFFIKNTRNFPNHAGADEQDWDYIAQQNTLIYFAISDQRHAIRNIDIKRSLDLGSFFRAYSVKEVKNSTNSKMVTVEGNYNSLDLGELKSFYEWCKTQSYHQKMSICAYHLQSSNNVKQTVTITYQNQGEFFHLDIS